MLRRGVFSPSRGALVGAVLRCAVDAGHVALALPRACRCGCGQAFADHWGAYHAEGGADALFLRDRSLPAASTREWAVADPARVRVEACGEVRGDRVGSASYLVE